MNKPTESTKEDIISIQTCQASNMNKFNKECIFYGKCIHQSILTNHIKYCLRG